MFLFQRIHKSTTKMCFEVSERLYVVHCAKWMFSQPHNALQWLSALDVPVRVFQATVDPVTPIAGTRQLLADCAARGKQNMDLVVWDQEGLGHIGISTTPTFPAEIKRFADSVHGRE